ncbi:hypothetical protein ACIRBY_38175 [Streptomyces sp. NPDC096136]|uniref:hypothetical protein n=1 Tax=Streptomyces sp. NPDC096136 TaxID=3366076 RepID=UPI00382B1D55
MEGHLAYCAPPVISHRLSTIREADQILFVEAGEIRKQGTIEELLNADGRYGPAADGSAVVML